MKIFIIREYYFLDNDVIVIRDSNDDDGSEYSWIEHPATLSYYQAVTDHLGSIIAVYDKSQRKVFEASYDAWEKQTVTLDEIDLHHGYTGHEMLFRSGLTHMDGRVYDPAIGRFLSPDNFVQLPDNSQSFNRYSYCINNPLKYTDPSGQSFLAVFAFATNFICNLASGDNFWAAYGKAYVSSALTSSASYGIGSAFGHAVGSVGHELLRAGAHGLASGVMNALQGENFGAGFASGAIASFAGSGAQWAGLGTYGTLGATTLFGGIGSAAFGGDFLQGAMTGLNIGLYNHTYKVNGMTVNTDNPNEWLAELPNIDIVGHKTPVFRAAKFIGEFSLMVGAYDYISKNTGIDSKGRFRYRQASGKLSPNATPLKVLKSAPKLGLGMSIASQIPSVIGAFKQYGLNDIRFLRTATVATGSVVGGCIGSVWGTQLGSVSGGFVGSSIPLAGSAAGAVVGGMAGGVAGGYYGSEFGGNLAGRLFDVVF